MGKTIAFAALLLALFSAGCGGLRADLEPALPTDSPEESKSIHNSDPKEKEFKSAKAVPEKIMQNKWGLTTPYYLDLPSRFARYKKFRIGWDRGGPYANWQEIEPRKREYHWERIDAYVAVAQEYEIGILFQIWPFTNWDQEIGNPHLPWQTNDWGKDPRDHSLFANRKGMPHDLEAYRKFLRLLVERYDGDGRGDMEGLRYPVKHWEIGNEPSAEVYFQGSPREYFEILKISYLTIKETDPDAKVLIADLPTLGPRPQFFEPHFGDAEEIFLLGGAQYFDIMNVHGFGRREELTGLLRKYGADQKPVWMTEPGGFPSLARTLTKEQLQPHFDREYANGVQKIWSMPDGNPGLPCDPGLACPDSN